MINLIKDLLLLLLVPFAIAIGILKVLVFLIVIATIFAIAVITAPFAIAYEFFFND